MTGPHENGRVENGRVESGRVESGRVENGRDETLERWIGRALDQAPPQRLDDGELSALFGDELPEATRGELVDRLIADRGAIDRVKSLRPLRAWSDGVAGVAGAIEESRRFQARRLQPSARWALAAMLLAALSLPLLLPRLALFEPAPFGTPETLRAPATVAPVAVEPADGARLEAAPRSFVFSVPAEPGRAFTVLLFDQHSTLLWRSAPVSEQSVELPADVASQLVAGRVYLWRVASDDGLDERRWPLATFEIVP